MQFIRLIPILLSCMVTMLPARPLDVRGQNHLFGIGGMDDR